MSTQDEIPPLLERVKSRYTASGQIHVLDNYDTLTDDADRIDFLRRLDSVEVEKLSTFLESALEEQRQHEESAAEGGGGGGGGGSSIAPLSGEVAVTSDVNLMEECRVVGMDAVKKGSVAAVLLAGGQGTRLGFDGPKGMYDFGMSSGRTLFQLVAERILKLTRLAAADGGGGGDGKVSVPLYVMTSPMNDDRTRKYFAEKNYFGLPPSDVKLFAQGVLPCLSDPGGKILMDGPTKCAMAPDGNGGIYPAMDKSGVLADMAARGIEHVHTFAIDNALVRPADPVFVGYCIKRGADCGNKVLWKTGPHEKVGVVAERDGKPCVVEYSDLSKEMAELVDGDGRLKFGAGNIANHYYTLDFLRNVVVPNMTNMYHVARKKIPVWDNDKGTVVKPETNNGIKLESFIFDVFPLSTNMAILDVERTEEFAPVKNAPGAKSDSPDTARELLSDLSKKWMKDAGAALLKEDVAGGTPSEVGPLTSYAGEGLEEYKGKEVECPFSL